MDNGYTARYQEQAINTMTKGELLVFLYDELLKRLTHAEVALKVEKYELFEESIDRAMSIIKYLQDTLKSGYEISNSLDKLYEYFCYTCMRIKAGRNQSLIDEIKPHIKELRDSFQEASLIEAQG